MEGGGFAAGCAIIHYPVASDHSALVAAQTLVVFVSALTCGRSGATHSQTSSHAVMKFLQNKCNITIN
jgi:hypothetical protein